MTVGELYRRMSPTEFRRWQRFAAFEPFIPERVDIAGALVAQLLFNINRTKNVPAAGISDFMLVERWMSLSAQKRAIAAISDPDEREEVMLASMIVNMGGAARG